MSDRKKLMALRDALDAVIDELPPDAHVEALVG